MKRILIPILILSLLLMPSVASAASGVQVVDKTEEDGEWTDTTWQVEMFPGETKATTITLHNSSSRSLDVEVSITPDSLDSGNLTFELDKMTFIMSGGSDEYVTLTVRASGSATPKVYTTELTIKSEIPSRPSGGGGGGARDTTPPRIYDVLLCGIGETTADICWKTKEKSNSQVEYWTSPSMLSPLDETYVVEHCVQLTGLTPGTIYYYKAMSEDRAGNLEISEKYSFTTLGEAPAAAFAIKDLSISPPEVEMREEVTISVLVTNTGDLAGSYEVTLKIDGVVEETKEVTLKAGAGKEVTFTTAKDATGNYSVDVNGLSGLFTVKAALPPPPPPPEEPIKPPLNWPLIGSIIAGAVIAGVLVFFFIRRKAAQANK